MLGRQRCGGRDGSQAMSGGAKPLLAVHDLVKHYPVGGGLFSRDTRIVHAVEGVSFEIGKGETVGLVGESGSGKSTISKMIMRLERPTSGSILFEGRDVAQLREKELKEYRRKV